jgi:hypothetical protein
MKLKTGTDKQTKKMTKSLINLNMCTLTLRTTRQEHSVVHQDITELRMAVSNERFYE